jgi:hypothetical protein
LVGGLVGERKGFAAVERCAGATLPQLLELRAESKGDPTEVLRIRLRYAEEDLARAKDRFEKGFLNQQDYEQAKLKVELLQAQLAPAPVPSPTTNQDPEHR